MDSELMLERRKAAQQIKKIRNLEREQMQGRDNRSGWGRDLHGYIDWMDGIAHFLSYVRRLKEDGILLDIGSGANIGITELARINLGRGLRFIGTNLSRVQGAIEDPNPVRIVRTSAETLNGIDDETVSGVMAVASIAYSDAPTLVVSSIDRVLIPGGLVKSVFRSLNGEVANSQYFRFKTHHRFSKAFQELGYDVAVGPDLQENIMVAVKPGETQPVNGAEGLLKIDKSNSRQTILSF